MTASGILTLDVLRVGLTDLSSVTTLFTDVASKSYGTVLFSAQCVSIVMLFGICEIRNMQKVACFGPMARKE